MVKIKRFLYLVVFVYFLFEIYLVYVLKIRCYNGIMMYNIL